MLSILIYLKQHFTKIMNELLSYIQKEWVVLSSAPFTFFSFFLLSVGFAVVILKYRYEGSLETLRERIHAKDEQLSTCRERLQLVKDHTSYSILGNTELRTKALELVENIRGFILKRGQVEKALFNYQTDKTNVVKTEEELQRDWNINIDKSIRESTITISEYNKKFKADTIILRDELLTRLPEAFIVIPTVWLLPMKIQLTLLE